MLFQLICGDLRCLGKPESQLTDYSDF